MLSLPPRATTTMFLASRAVSVVDSPLMVTLTVPLRWASTLMRSSAPVPRMMTVSPVRVTLPPPRDCRAAKDS